MPRMLKTGLLLSILLPAALATRAAQSASSNPNTPEAKPLAFVVADIHPSPFSYSGNNFHEAPLVGDRFVIHQATPLDLITKAYDVEHDAVTGGPPALEFDHYEIVAKTSPGVTETDTDHMLQSLLADRFKLVVAKEQRLLPAFLLQLGKGTPKFKPAADLNAESGCRYQPPDPPPPPGTWFPSTVLLKCSNITMAQFAEQLSEFASAYLNHPVADQTGLKGAWDFDFRFSWQPTAVDQITVFEAVDKLGLSLQAGTAPRPALAITSMRDTPTPNVAEIAKLLPPAPLPAFEVAVIRQSKSDFKEAQARLESFDQVTLSGTERRLISMAWDISEKTIFEAPAYMDDKVWEISAKIPLQTPDLPQKPITRPQVDFDQVRLMLRSLLIERFGLKWHIEDRPGNAYTLQAGTPKLKIADPANRASCTDRVAPGEKDPRTANPMVTQYMHCTSVTIDQFARELQGYSGYIIKTPVLNATGIEGRYDLTLSFTGLHQLEALGLAQGGGTPAAGAPRTEGPGAGDPTGVVLLQDAVAKQLGLRLMLEKRPIPAFVVESMLQQPTEN